MRFRKKEIEGFDEIPEPRPRKKPAGRLNVASRLKRKDLDRDPEKFPPYPEEEQEEDTEPAEPEEDEDEDESIEDAKAKRQLEQIRQQMIKYADFLVSNGLDFEFNHLLELRQFREKLLKQKEVFGSGKPKG